MEISIEKKRMEVIDMFGIINKLKSAAAISMEYHNMQGVTLTANIDRILREYKQQEASVGHIAEAEMHKLVVKVRSNKDTFGGSEVRKVTA